MITFKNYLEEAKFDDDSLGRVVSTFEKSKFLGTKINRHGGPSGTYDGGILYYFGKNAFKLRIKGGRVTGIDLWKPFALNLGPSHYIDVSQVSADTLLKSMSKLAKVLKNPTEGQVQLAESTIMEMARRVDSDTFYNSMIKAYGEAGAESVTWEQIKKVADEEDVQIPAYIRDQKIGRGKWNSKPGAASSDGEAKADSASNKKQPTYFIKVTAQDPDTKRFISAGSDAGAQKMYAQIQNALGSDSIPTKAELKDPDTLYGHLSQLVAMACSNKLRSLLIYGGPGTGKTYTIMQTIKEQGLTPGKDYVKLSGKASPIKIYETLFMYRDAGLVVFDDLDSMWRNEDATNILKAALDTSPVREISWSSAQTINVAKMSDSAKEELFKNIDKQISGELEVETDQDEDDGDEGEDDGKRKKKKKEKVVVAPDKIKYPSTFEFKGRVVFISNLKKDEFDEAILSRSAKIDMSLTPEQILQRMRKILPTLGGNDVSIELKEELIDQLLKMHKSREITQVTMREFTKCLDIVRSGASNWRELCQYA